MSYDNKFNQPFKQGFSKPYGGNNDNQGGYRGGYQGNNNNGGAGGNTGNNNQDKPLPEPFFYKTYAVVGNRDTPANICERAKDVASRLANAGFIARVSGMDGLDKTIMESLSEGKFELQLPWKNFANLESRTSYSSPEVLAIAKHFSDGWDNLKLPVKGFLGKNVRVLLGEKAKSPAMFLLVHSEDGADNAQSVTSRTGSAGHAIKIASFYNIPIFNIQNPDSVERLYQQFHLLKDETRPMIEDDRLDI